MERSPLLFVMSLALVGCTGQIETGMANWTLVADSSGALVDRGHPEFGAYPNPRGVDSVRISVHSDGSVCADSAAGLWCGGPIQGIPYLTRAVTDGSDVCMRVLDLYGNLVTERCGLVGDFTFESASAGCEEAETAAGSCRICTDDHGTVTENSCGDGPLSDDLVCENRDQALAVGVYLFQRAFNDALERVGLPFQVAIPTSPGWLVDFDEGEISLTDPSCGDIYDYLDDEFSDDHPGTDDYVFGEDAIAECLERGRCRIGQLVTRAMADACQAIPVGCDMELVQMAIIGSGGYAVQAVCAGEGALEDDDKVGIISDGGTGVEDCVGSPLVLDLAGDGLALKGTQGSARFALWGARPMSVGWLAGGDDALLALDLDGDGAITSGRELFGEATGGWAPDGFAALARHDQNGDLFIDASDPVFASLLAWVDDGDAVSSAEELRPLATTGITSISLSAVPVGQIDVHGNELGLAAPALHRDGASTPVIDVWFVFGGR
ncbi:MAG: hypothetical protein JRF63_14530 [Deltaproteobacteria bacterium]|nr:hypothetical protein [Deltaproteobacteria bacterium]